MKVCQENVVCHPFVSYCLYCILIFLLKCLSILQTLSAFYPTQEQLGFGSTFLSGAVTFAQHLAWLRGNVTTLRGTVDQDRSSGERSDEELADMIMEAKRRCDVKNRDELMIKWNCSANIVLSPTSHSLWQRQ